MLFAKCTVLGYESLSIEEVPFRVLEAFQVLSADLRFCFKGKNSTMFSGDTAVLKCCFSLSQYSNEIKILNSLSSFTQLKLLNHMMYLDHLVLQAHY